MASDNDDGLGLEDDEGIGGGNMPADGMGVPGMPPENVSYEVPAIPAASLVNPAEMMAEGQPQRLAEAGFQAPENIAAMQPAPVAVPGQVARAPKDLANPGPAPVSKLVTAQQPQSNVAVANLQPVNNDTMAGAQAQAAAMAGIGMGNPQPVSPSPGQPATIWGTQKPVAPIQPIPVDPQVGQMQAMMQQMQAMMGQVKQNQQFPTQQVAAAHHVQQAPSIPGQPGVGYAYEAQPGLMAYDPNNFPIHSQFVVNNTLFEVVRHNTHYTKILLRRVG